MTIDIRHGDSREVLKSLADCSIDSCVTDPPYSLVSIQKRFGKAGSAPAKDRDGVYKRASAGFMGQSWDTGETAFSANFWAEVWRVLKPGAHLLAFSGTRTYHRMVCAIEDAGFEIRDQIGWVYGSGFPKSHDVSKGIDKAAGAERQIIGKSSRHAGVTQSDKPISDLSRYGASGDVITAAATDAARQWEGWGTALKPAWEPIVLARKPLIGTVAANVLQHGTGALNIDGCRVEADDKTPAPVGEFVGSKIGPAGHSGARDGASDHLGRWPANICHDGSEEVVAAFPDSDGQQGLTSGREPSDATKDIYGKFKRVAGQPPRLDSGSAARFFYSAKADAEDRLGSRHPTVKPVDLMAYLCRLVTPPGGTVLDPFAGSGTTGMACMREGFDCILIEREAAYIADIKRRLAHVKGEDTPLFAPAQEAML